VCAVSLGRRATWDGNLAFTPLLRLGKLRLLQFPRSRDQWLLPQHLQQFPAEYPAAFCCDEVVEQQDEEDSDDDDKIKIHTDSIDLGEMDVFDMNKSDSIGSAITLDGVEELFA
jgi:hypothetical protein